MTEFDFEIAADTFYRELFSALPAVKDMFSESKKQRSMFITALRTIYYGGNEGQTLDDYLALLGDKHRELGLLSFHMDVGAQAFSAAIDAANPEIGDTRKDELMASFGKLCEAMGFQTR